MARILLFGTSANPPTGRDGHSGIIDYFVGLGVCSVCVRICMCLWDNKEPFNAKAD